MLHGIDLLLPRGEFCAVMGPSGLAGKSTLLNIVGSAGPPDRRRTGAWLAEPTTGLSDRALTQLRAGAASASCSSTTTCCRAFSALGNVMLPMLGQAGFARPAIAQRAAALLDSVGLTHVGRQPASHLSGGQQQRVAGGAGARDGPAAAARRRADRQPDLAQRRCGLSTRCARSISSTALAILFVTHNLALARRCDRIIRSSTVAWSSRLGAATRRAVQAPNAPAISS